MDSRTQQTSLFSYFKSSIEIKPQNRKCSVEAPFLPKIDKRKRTRSRLESKEGVAATETQSQDVVLRGEVYGVQAGTCQITEKEEHLCKTDRENAAPEAADNAWEKAGCLGRSGEAPKKGEAGGTGKLGLDPVEADDQGEEGVGIADEVKGVSFPGTKRKRVEMQEPPAVTDLERQRDENIRKNEEFLATLGIDCNLLAPRKAPYCSKSKLRSKKVAPPPTMRVQRSTRASVQKAEPIAEPLGVEAQAAVEEFIHYDDSTVRQYTCSMQSPGSREEASCSSIDGFEPAGTSYCDPVLTRVYALDESDVKENSQGQLLAAGGHAGRLAVFGTRGDVWPAELSEQKGSGTPDEPLLSWKGGAGWISAVQFLKQQNATLLLTSSNDKSVVLWDLDKSSSATGGPRIVAQTATLHSNGIFGMHELGGQVATASKDKTVAVTTVTCTGLSPLAVLTGHHSSAVRSVHFRDAFHLADGSADRSVVVSDLRLAEPGSICIEDAHQTAVNVVHWHPTIEHLLLSASHDPEILLHDIRFPQQPLYSFSGHLGARLARSKSIYRPSFVVEGKYIASPGEGSQAVSLYEVATGKTVSRGCLGFDATMTSAGKLGSHLWLTAEGGVLQRYRGSLGVVATR